jgi:hypothetical protein
MPPSAQVRFYLEIAEGHAGGVSVSGSSAGRAELWQKVAGFSRGSSTCSLVDNGRSRGPRSLRDAASCRVRERRSHIESSTRIARHCLATYKVYAIKQAFDFESISTSVYVFASARLTIRKTSSGCAIPAHRRRALVEETQILERIASGPKGRRDQRHEIALDHRGVHPRAAPEEGSKTRAGFDSG